MPALRNGRLCRQGLGGGGKAGGAAWLDHRDRRQYGGGAVELPCRIAGAGRHGADKERPAVGRRHDGHLLIFNAANGMLIKSIDTGGALNSGLISYSVRGVQYVAANVGGPTQNPSTVAGPLRVVIYSIFAKARPEVVTLPRLDLPPPPNTTPEHAIFGQACEAVPPRRAPGLQRGADLAAEPARRPGAAEEVPCDCAAADAAPLSRFCQRR